MIRVGFGYDVHRLVAGRPLILGGITIPSDRGCDGHSDADVLLHAISDALLGAIAAGDIGAHFPDTDPKWKGANSATLLKVVMEMVKREGYAVGNVDATVALEQPKIRKHIDAMRENIARILSTDVGRVSVKATTSEGMGFVGVGDGATAYATALIVSTDPQP